MQPRASAILLSLTAICVPLAAADPSGADVVDLRFLNGDRVQGPLIDETPDAYVVHQTMQTRKGQMAADRTFAKADIKEAVHVRPEYDKRAAAAGDGAAAQGALAAWCLDEQLRDEADRHAHRALAKDPANADGLAVLSALGYVQDHGTWMTADDYLAAHGLAQREGKVMTTAQRDTLVALASQCATDRAADEAAQSTLALVSAAIARDKGRIDALAKEKADLGKHDPADHAGIRDADTAKRALDAANAQVQKEESTRIKHKNAPTTNGVASDASLAAQKKAKQDYAAATDAAHQAQGDLATVQQRQAAIASDSATASTDLAAQQAKVAAATSAAAATKTKAQASGQHYREVFDAIIPPADLPPQLAKGSTH